MANAVVSKGKPSSQDRTLHWRALGYLLAALSAPVFLSGRDHLPDLTLQLRLLPFALLVCAGLWLCLQPLPRQLTSKPLPGWPVLLGFLGAILVLGQLGGHAGQLSRYAHLGFGSNWRLLGTGTIVLSLCFLGLARRREQNPGKWLLVILLAGIFAMFYSMNHYPLNTGRSDMLTLLEHGGKAWLRGASLTDAYQPDPKAQLTYFPGLWLTYLPAVALGVDLRWMSMLSALAASALLWHATPVPRRFLSVTLLMVFWLSPWFQFRHEAYVHGIFFFAALTAWGLMTQRPWVAVGAQAWMATQSQLGWVVLPFILWHVRLRLGWAKAVVAGLAVLAVWGLVVGPYLIHDHADFTANVFRLWEGQFGVPSPNASYWLHLFLPLKALRAVQALALVVLFLSLARRLSDPLPVLQGSCLALFVFIATNNLVRDYFYFLPLLLLAFCLAAAPPRSARSS